jgi:hypothetical protein
VITSPRALGAGLALLLDLVVLAIAVVVRAGQAGPLDFVVLGALGGAIALPIAGRAAAPTVMGSRRAGLTRFVSTAALLGAVVWFVYVVGFLFIVGPPGGPGTEFAFLLYSLAWTPLGIGVLVTLWLPVAAVWTFAMPFAWQWAATSRRRA